MLGTEPITRRITPEQRLWQAVILQALVDISITSIHPEEKRRAQEFAGKPSNDLLWICNCAGISMNKVIKAAQKGIDGDWLRLLRYSLRNKK